VIDPTNSLKVFAATDAGVYGSDTGGTLWGLSKAAFVNCLVRDPGQPATLYAGAGHVPTSTGGLFKSTAGGAAGTWTASGSGIRNLSVASLAASPASGAVYAGHLHGIARTTDSGGTWQTLLPVGAIITLAVDPSQPLTIYAGSFGFGVNKTTDGGATWPPVNTGLTNLFVQALVIDPAAPATAYAGTAGGVFKTTDGAATWNAASTGITSTNVRALAIDSAVSSTLYAGTSGGVFKSSNGGAAWSPASSGLPAGLVFALAIDPASPRTLYAGTASGPYRSSDGGGTWSAANAGLSSSTVRILRVGPAKRRPVCRHARGCLLLGQRRRELDPRQRGSRQSRD
jgi:photosystem II stability/assembly factor-like uncharacterized protein